jgi:signal transduction histidine kinase
MDADGDRLSRWSARCLIAIAALGSLTLTLAVRVVPGTQDASWSDFVWLLAWFSFAAVGALIAAHRPDNRLGWLFLAIGGLVVLAACLDESAFAVAEWQSKDATAVAWLRWAQNLMFVPPFLLVPVSALLFPTGRLERPWLRWPVRALLAVIPIGLLGAAVSPGPIGEDLPVENPVGVQSLASAADVADGLLALTLLAGLICAVVWLVQAGRSGDDERRAQVAWLALGVSLAVVVNVTAGLAGAAGLDPPETLGALIESLAVVAVPAAAAAAVLRHNLLDAPRLLRSSAVYLVLSALLLGGYLALAAGLGAAVPTRGRVGAALIAVVIALLALPLRSALQRVVERRVYGDSADPLRAVGSVVARLGADGEVGPAAAVAELRRVLKVPHAALEVDVGVGRETLVSSGERPAWACTEVPLVDAGRTVGWIVVSSRGPRDPLRPKDLEVLAGVASHVGLAMRAAALAGEVRESAAATVRARADEQRRLRDELHDRIGPVLAAVRLQVGVSRDSSSEAPVVAALDVAGTRLEEAIADLRRVIVGLRPPALDELGLAAALHAQLEAFRSPGAPDVALVGATALPELPAAVEVVAYRVVLEAVSNAVRHSGAGSCEVELAVRGDDLVISVHDDGCGIPAQMTAGVGSSSLAHSCAQVGGELAVTARLPRGTSVTARLPLGAPA